VANGKTTLTACRELEHTEQTYSRRGKEYGEAQVDRARRLEEPVPANAKLKRLGSDLGRDKPISKDIASGVLQARRGGAHRPISTRIYCQSASGSGFFVSLLRRGVSAWRARNGS
jgi:hypothetical protein